MYNSNKSIQKPTYLPKIKNTEDDTFRVLSRPDFTKIRNMIREKLDLKPYERLTFMRHYGWTWKEYVTECDIRNLPNSC